MSDSQFDGRRIETPKTLIKYVADYGTFCVRSFINSPIYYPCASLRSNSELQISVDFEVVATTESPIVIDVYGRDVDLKLVK